MRLIIFVLSIMLIPCVACAKSTTIYANFKYTLDDNDSKNDARRIAFIEARKLVVEKATAFIESETQARNAGIPKDDLKSYTAAIVTVETDKEEFDAASQSLNMTVKTTVDIEPVLLTLSIIKDDKGLQKKIRDEQKQLKSLEEKLDAVKKSIYAEKKGDKALSLRKKRADILTNMSDSMSENLSQNRLDIDELQARINKVSDKVVKNIRNGMTHQEVMDILGKPRQAESYFDKQNSNTTYCENYGKFWLITDSNKVVGYVSYDNYTGCNPGTIKTLIPFEVLIR